MSNQKGKHNKDNDVETTQCNLATSQNSGETEQPTSETSQVTDGSEHITSEPQESSDKGNTSSSDASRDSVAAEEPSAQTTSSWNTVNAGVAGQKTKIKGRDDRNKENPEFKFYEELSKRFVEQQDQVISQRKHLLIWFAWITASQLLVINVLIFICIFGNQESLNVTLSFMKFFVGATFLELLGGLLIIVKFVFSHETFDMLKHLTYVEPPAKD